MAKGYIHSFETFGTKDGPGIRFVLFMQGCPLRCLYCHNPDTWKMGDAKYELTADEVFTEVDKVKAFVKGGLTVSGGEPFLQSDFLLELFKQCKDKGVHTAIDTSGYLLNDKVKDVLKYSDLVLLDIKHIDPNKYKTLTSKELKPTLRFAEYLEEINKPLWLRYVLVPGYSDNEADLHNWAKYTSRFENIERIDVLPFHQMGAHKWEQMELEYKLKHTRQPTSDEIARAEKIFSSYFPQLFDSKP